MLALDEAGKGGYCAMRDGGQRARLRDLAVIPHRAAAGARLPATQRRSRRRNADKPAHCRLSAASTMRTRAGPTQKRGGCQMESTA